jgi:hypothetical protein
MEIEKKVGKRKIVREKKPILFFFLSKKKPIKTILGA